jgi:hypothetical protein
LGFLENGRERVVPGHFLSLEFDLDLVPFGGGAKLLEGGILQSFAMMKKYDLAVVRYDAERQGLLFGLRAGGQ